MIALKLIPPYLIAENRAKAAQYLDVARSQYKIMAATIIGIWIAFLLLAGWIIFHSFFK